MCATERRRLNDHCEQRQRYDAVKIFNSERAKLILVFSNTQKHYKPAAICKLYKKKFPNTQIV
jgi:hypothetical protein